MMMVPQRNLTKMVFCTPRIRICRHQGCVFPFITPHGGKLAGDGRRRPVRGGPDSRPQDTAHDTEIRAPFARIHGRCGEQVGRGVCRFAAGIRIFAEQPSANRRALVIFSDMRQSTPCLDLESAKVVLSFPSAGHRCGEPAVLENVQIYVAGADGAGRSTEYWQKLRKFWEALFQNARALLRSYTMLRELPSSKIWANDTAEMRIGQLSGI